MASKANSRTTKGKTGAPRSTPASVSKIRSRLPIWLLTAAMLTAGLVYSPALNGPFIFDDYNLPFSNPNADSMPIAFWIGGVRPALMASYWLNYQVSGIHTLSYHAVNITFHAATAVVVFFLLL